jgi:hypothetical protein
MSQSQSQKAWLAAVKRTLSKERPGLTWDELADMAGIDPRAFKTYRMPESSADFRRMPSLVQAAIKALVDRMTVHAPVVPPLNQGTPLLLPALAALVVRQARLSLIEGQMISGISRSPGLGFGLVKEDRAAMALVSRACLVHGLPDHGAEIHDLLAFCTRPLGEWMAIPDVIEQGLGGTFLIEADEGVPTAEAQELASGFSGMTASLEEQLFQKFRELLARFPDRLANEYYTAVRSLVVRTPVALIEEIRTAAADLPARIWLMLQEQFYEPVPEAWKIGTGVPICARCHNALRPGRAGLVCRSNACRASYSVSEGSTEPASALQRVSRGIRHYWVEPGIDEIRLFDALVAMGHPAELYPHRDRVDIAVGEIGIDLKAYASPETLGRKFRQSLGGLAYYPTKWLVIPDWLIAATPDYLGRLRTTMARPEITVLGVDEGIARFRQMGAG